MLAEVTGAQCHWLCTGEQFFSAMQAAIEGAQQAVSLETYIYGPGTLGERFRDCLVGACRRRARVRLLIDALGSHALPADFWDPLREAGGEVRVFNPLSLHRLGIRNHRKLLVCDGRVAFVGGFNIAAEYEGDGVSCGWCDLGVKLEGPVAGELQSGFDEMFARAEFQHKRFVRFRRATANQRLLSSHEQLLLSGPGRGRNPIRRALQRDLAQARSVQRMVAYFLPPWRLRRQLIRLAREGAKVQLILAGKSDVAVSLLAARSLYRRFLRGNVEIYEYQPQILHAKLFIVDNAVYVGSANLDHRSLNINYELMVRFSDQQIAVEAREVFSKTLQHCRRITLEEWRKGRTLWERLKQRWAYLLLVRLDPYIARRQWKQLPD